MKVSAQGTACGSKVLQVSKSSSHAALTSFCRHRLAGAEGSALALQSQEKDPMLLGISHMQEMSLWTPAGLLINLEIYSQFYTIKASALCLHL